MRLPQSSRILLVSLALISVACTVGPTYKQPPVVVPPAFKEAPPAGATDADLAAWQRSAPGDAYAKGRWWELYNDAALNALEVQVNVSNQNVIQAEARYRQAKAAIGEARSALFPTVTVTPSITVGGTGGGSSTVVNPNGSTGRTNFDLPFDVSWEPDLWGSIRRGVAANVATAASMAAAVGNAELLYQAELAQDYFGLHGLDGQAALLTRTEASFQDYLTLTHQRFDAGIISGLDVAQAETQLYQVQSQLIDLGVQRSALEHAIAILIGKAPADLTIPATPQSALPPPVPVGVPSQLLERRPDIAVAERQVAAANEQIGIAMAASYPNLTLTGSAGFESSTLAKWFTWPARFWSLGPQLAATLFDAGRRRAVTSEQWAAYDVTVAGYRQAVLAAMQQVEDNLAALRIMSEESDKVDATVQAATRTLTISDAQYRAGTANYLTVITSQATLLNAEVSAVTLQTRRLNASVLLIEALGGGWNASRQQ